MVFDAFGNETEKTGTTANTYGFQGEEHDATGLYYLRARYMDPVSGTFTSMDTYAGSLSDPMSLHKYLFANSNPVMYSDPSGHFSLADIDAAMAIDCILNAGYLSGYLYIIDASITDPNLEHHDFTGYLSAIGLGMLFAVLNIVLSATVAGLLTLAIIDTILGATGTIKGVIDFINGHKVYGGFELLSSVLLTVFGWKNFASAHSVAKAVNTSSAGQQSSNECGTGSGSGNTRDGNQNTRSTFSDLMSEEDALRYEEYWQKNAPQYNTPDSRIDYYKEHNGMLERSRVIYDYAGRQKYRIDYTDHGRPDHSNPHLHEIFYGSGYDSVKGMEVRYDFFK